MLTLHSEVWLIISDECLKCYMNASHKMIQSDPFIQTNYPKTVCNRYRCSVAKYLPALMNGSFREC